MLCMQPSSASKRTLRELIDARGLRYGWVARQAGMSPSLLSMVMAGKRRLRPERRQALAKVLQVPAELLEDA